ncbi:MAG: 3-deoxy-manno-octulosonate cytidylyltransferase [Pigmentiphaga sp.]
MPNKPFTVLIPAREQSTRLPGKMLADLHGKPMVVRVAERARHSGAARIVVATDSETIRSVVAAHGIECLLTAADHPTGTDRLSEAARLLGLSDDDVVVNVQGDEPLIDPELIGRIGQLLGDYPQASIATAAHPITEADEFFDPNAVKVVVNALGEALYFSRAPIPWPRDAMNRGENTLPAGVPALRHIGLYAYRVAFLQRFPLLEQGQHERWESLEQLRALENGFRIQVHITQGAPAPGVDTAADLLLVRERFRALIDHPYSA